MKNYLFTIVLFTSTIFFGQNVFISEIHYDDSGADTGEGVEIAASVTTDLSGWSIVLYDNSGSAYSTVSLSGTLNAGSYLWMAYTGGSNPNYAINNSNGGIVLYDGSTVVEFLSYGGAITAVDGVASGATSTNLSVLESNSTANGNSMQLTDAGWVSDITATPGSGPSGGLTLSVTKNQIEDFIVYPNPVRNGLFSISTKNSADKHVIIYSILGSVVYNKSVSPNELVNVKNLSTGMYLVQVEEDEKVSISKLLVN